MQNKKAVCEEWYKKKVNQEQHHMTELDLQWEHRCTICMEPNSKFALPGRNHVMCLKCCHEWCVPPHPGRVQSNNQVFFNLLHAYDDSQL
jgi:hypothetical protein